MHSFILVFELWADHLASFFSAVPLLWFMKCSLVAPQSNHVSSASIAFCPVDCDAALISNMESNAGVCDRREVNTMDHNPSAMWAGQFALETGNGMQKYSDQSPDLEILRLHWAIS